MNTCKMEDNHYAVELLRLLKELDPEEETFNAEGRKKSRRKL